MSIHLAIILAWTHFFADFILQSDWMAINKSKRNDVLALHVTLYAMVLCVFGFKYALVNWLLHFATDFTSSRIASYFWRTERRHWFFVTIGVDQAIHLTCLFSTIPLMTRMI